MNQSKKISVDIGFANLVAELVDNDSIYPEVCISMENKTTGAWLQDIVLVRQTSKEDAGTSCKDSVDCLVWSDADDEDYTHKFIIEKYQEE